MLVLSAAFEAVLQGIWLAALALGFLGAAKMRCWLGKMHRSVVSKFTESQNCLEGLVTSFLEISLRVPDSVGQGGAGWGRAG